MAAASGSDRKREIYQTQRPHHNRAPTAADNHASNYIPCCSARRNQPARRCRPMRYISVLTTSYHVSPTSYHVPPTPHHPHSSGGVANRSRISSVFCIRACYHQRSSSRSSYYLQKHTQTNEELPPRKERPEEVLWASSASTVQAGAALSLKKQAPVP